MKASLLLNRTHVFRTTTRDELIKNMTKYITKKLHYSDVLVTINNRHILKIIASPKDTMKPTVLLSLDCGGTRPYEYFGKVTDLNLNGNELSEVIKSTL